MIEFSNPVHRTGQSLGKMATTNGLNCLRIS
jgi:hypothetical protein